MFLKAAITRIVFSVYEYFPQFIFKNIGSLFLISFRSRFSFKCAPPLPKNRFPFYPPPPPAGPLCPPRERICPQPPLCGELRQRRVLAVLKRIKGAKERFEDPTPPLCRCRPCDPRGGRRCAAQPPPPVPLKLLHGRQVRSGSPAPPRRKRRAEGAPLPRAGADESGCQPRRRGGGRNRAGDGIGGGRPSPCGRDGRNCGGGVAFGRAAVERGGGGIIIYGGILDGAVGVVNLMVTSSAK